MRGHIDVKDGWQECALRLSEMIEGVTFPCVPVKICQSSLHHLIAYDWKKKTSNFTFDIWYLTTTSIHRFDT